MPQFDVRLALRAATQHVLDGQRLGFAPRLILPQGERLERLVTHEPLRLPTRRFDQGGERGRAVPPREYGDGHSPAVGGQARAQDFPYAGFALGIDFRGQRARDAGSGVRVVDRAEDVESLDPEPRLRAEPFLERGRVGTFDAGEGEQPDVVSGRRGDGSRGDRRRDRRRSRGPRGRLRGTSERRCGRERGEQDGRKGDPQGVTVKSRGPTTPKSTLPRLAKRSWKRTRPRRNW